jgi:hypothetical protein
MLTQKNGTTVWQTEPKRLPHTEAHRESLGPRLVVPVLPIDTEVLSASLECVLAGLLDWPHGTLLAVTELILQRVVLMFAQIVLSTSPGLHTVNSGIWVFLRTWDVRVLRV